MVGHKEIESVFDGVIKTLKVTNTSIVVVLTADAVVLIDETTLIPLAARYNSQYGNNKDVKIKQLDTLSTVNIINLFLTTDTDYLIVYQVTVDPSLLIYEVYNDQEQIIQKRLPVTMINQPSFLKKLGQLARIINNATTVNLENIENFNNTQQEEELHYCKITIFKVIKVGIGITNYWLKPNSHDLFVYNNNMMQIINIKTLHNEVIDCNKVVDEPIEKIWYNYKDSTFIALTASKLWSLEFSGDLVGKQLTYLPFQDIKLNPRYKLALVLLNNKLQLYKFQGDFELIKSIPTKWDNPDVNWSPNGEFFSVCSEKTWFIATKFGNISTNTEELSQESTDPVLPASNILISSNHGLLTTNDNRIAKVSLTNLKNYDDLILCDSQLISIIDANRVLKFPLLDQFKPVDFKISTNDHHQFILSHGNKLAISTPYKEVDYKHILWYNFKNYYLEDLHILGHFTFHDYLILINSTTADNGANIHEIIILNIENSRYGTGGNQFHFDSDLIVWRQKISMTTSVSIINNNLLVLDVHHKLVIFELLQNYTKNEVFYKFFIKVSKTINLSIIKDRIELEDISTIRMLPNMNFLLMLNTGDFYLLKNQSNRILLTNYYQLIKIQNSVEYFKIESLDINNETIEYIYLFQGNNLLIYNLSNLIDLVFDTTNNPNDGIDDLSSLKLILPISIDLVDFQPLKIVKTKESINIVGIQESIINDNIKQRVNSRLVLNDLIEFDLLNEIDPEIIIQKFQGFGKFKYCLELLLFNYLTNESELLEKLVVLIKSVKNHESIVTNCLRKIEFRFWKPFFNLMETSPIKFMDHLLNTNKITLSYQFLIVYLNLKVEESKAEELDKDDEKTILKIIKSLMDANHWDGCFELCRFVKLLDSSSGLLLQVRHMLT